MRLISQLTTLLLLTSLTLPGRAVLRSWDLADDVFSGNMANAKMLLVRPYSLQVAIGSSESNQLQSGQAPKDTLMDSFEAILSSDPQNKTARDGEVKEAIAEALSLRNSGSMNVALAILARAKAYVPDDPNLLMAFGVQADSMHIYRDADAALEQAHHIAPNAPKILYGLAHVELDEQKMPEAESDLRAYLRMCPEDASAHYGLGHLLHMTLKDDEAEVELKRSLQLQPEQTESWYELGDIAVSRNETVEAKSDFEKVLQRDPHHGGALTDMGRLSYKAKDYLSAEKYLSQAVVVAPEYPAAHRFYAILLAREGKKEQADKEEALAGKLTEEQNRLQRGYVLLQEPHSQP